MPPMPMTSSPWVCVTPGKEYRLYASGGDWALWTLQRPTGVNGGDWYLTGPEFHGFGLGRISLSSAHWRACAMVVEMLTRQDADAMNTILWEPEAHLELVRGTASGGAGTPPTGEKT
jgi:hypothetical protein